MNENDKKISDINSAKKEKPHNFSLYMNDKKKEYTKKDATEDVERIANKILKASRGPMTKICLTIFACSVVKTAGRVLIARNYAKKA